MAELHSQVESAFRHKSNRNLRPRPSVQLPSSGLVRESCWNNESEGRGFAMKASATELGFS